MMDYKKLKTFLKINRNANLRTPFRQLSNYKQRKAILLVVHRNVVPSLKKKADWKPFYMLRSIQQTNIKFCTWDKTRKQKSYSATFLYTADGEANFEKKYVIL